MATEIAPYAVKITGVAGADLSAKQYQFVKQTGVQANGTPTVDVCSAATDAPIGVLQNAPISGQEAEVVMVGGTKIKGSAALTGGAAIATAADGRAAAVTYAAASTTLVAGRMLSTTGAANEIGSAVVNCASPSRALA